MEMTMIVKNLKNGWVQRIVYAGDMFIIGCIGIILLLLWHYLYLIALVPTQKDTHQGTIPIKYDKRQELKKTSLMLLLENNRTSD